jgi:hypothetical protein
VCLGKCALGLSLTAGQHPLGFLAVAGEYLLGLGMCLTAHTLGLRQSLAPDLLGIAQAFVRLAVKSTHCGEGLVPGCLRLGAGSLEDLLRLLLGRLHAVLGRPVGFGDPLPPALLGPLAQPSGRALRRLEDAHHAGRSGAQVVGVGDLSGMRVSGDWRFHQAMVNRDVGPRQIRRANVRWQETWETCPCRQARGGP